jgi:hypothetical protein
MPWPAQPADLRHFDNERLIVIRQLYRKRIGGWQKRVIPSGWNMDDCMTQPGFEVSLSNKCSAGFTALSLL